MMGRPGYALVFSLLMVLALATLTTGMFALGTRDAMVEAERRRLAYARRQAEADVRRAAARWSTARDGDLPVGAAPTAFGPVPGVTRQRVDSALYLVRAEATIGRATAAAAILIRTVRGASLVEGHEAAVEVRDAADIRAGTVVGAGGCGVAAAAGIRAPVVTIHPNAEVSGSPPWDSGGSTSVPLPPALLSGVASVGFGGGAIGPSAVASGEACVAGSGNWGTPDPSHPCHPAPPVIHASSDTRVTGGSALGVLLVDGDLVVEGDAVLTGVVVVTGTLVVRDGAVVRGFARSSHLRVDGGEVRHDRCAALAALASPDLDGAFRPDGRWWIPVF